MTEEEDEEPILETISMSSSSIRRRNSRSNENPTRHSLNRPHPELSYTASLTSSQVPDSNNVPIQLNNNSPITQNEPQKSDIRFVLCWLAMLGFAIVYILRVNMSIAIVAMTSNSTNTTGEAKFDWTEKQKGEILGSFFYGYVASQILGGYLSDKYNIPATVFGVGVAGTSILTAFTPMAARMGITPLCVLRVLEGVFEGVTIPAITSFWGKWAPPDERSRLQGWSLNGTILGTVIGLTSTAFLSSIEGLGWESSFYIFGFIGLLWCWIWFMVASDTPGNNDWISSFEKNYIENSERAGQQESVRFKTSFPLKMAFTKTSVYAVIFAHFCHGWSGYTILNDLPLYLSYVFDLKLTKTALVASLPPVFCFIFGILNPLLVDKLIKSNRISTPKVRKISQTITFAGRGICALLIAILPQLNPTIIIIILIFNAISTSFHATGLGCTHLDMVGPHAGIFFGISNTAANIGGFLVPLVAGFLTEDDPESRSSWIWVWLLVVFTQFAGMLVFLGFADPVLQDWVLEDVDRNEEIQDEVILENY